MEHLLFQKAVPDDAKTIIETRQKAWDATYHGIYPDEMIDDFDWDWHLKAERRRLSNPAFYCCMIYDDEKCVGYFSYGTIRPGTWKDFSFRLHSLYLLPAYQGMGIGRGIFEQVREACIASGNTKMFLDCHPMNQNALAFYRHMGGAVAQVDSGHENPQEDTCTIEFYF